MEEFAEGRTFVNSEEIGEFADVIVPTAPDGTEEEIRIHYYEEGNGEPLVLIHGIGQSLYTWRYLYGELSMNYRVIAIDLPGHGYSSRPESFCYSMDEMAETIRAFLEVRGIVSAHMVGFSTGAMYMLHFLSKYPEMVANCIAIAPGGITARMPRGIRNFKSRFKAVFSRNLFTERTVGKWLREAVNDFSLFDGQAVKQYYEPVSDGLTREALMYAVQNFDMKYATDEIRESDHEVLMLWGKEDAWHNPNNSVFFKGILKNGRYFLIRNAGHIVQEEVPEKVLEVIENYIPVIPVAARRGYYRNFVNDGVQTDADETYLPGEAPVPEEPEEERFDEEAYAALGNELPEYPAEEDAPLTLDAEDYESGEEEYVPEPEEEPFGLTEEDYAPCDEDADAEEAPFALFGEDEAEETGKDAEGERS
ncbi:MAG: alpha/beta hydrolase [Clostridia bacterium]|nr:alpha/beta hydrolase [Clostridia bacterium]